MNRNDELVVALMVIDLGGTFSKTYRFCGLLSLKFDIADCVGIIRDLGDSRYITYVEEQGVEIFTITPLGRKVLNENRLRVGQILETEFPKERAVIERMKEL